MKIVINNRHKNFVKLIEETLAKLNITDYELKAKLNEEDKDKIIISPSKFAELDDFKYVLYFNILFSLDRDERQQTLNALENDYEFYKKYLKENCIIKIEYLKSKKTLDKYNIKNKIVIDYKAFDLEDAIKLILLITSNRGDIK